MAVDTGQLNQLNRTNAIGSYVTKLETLNSSKKLQNMNQITKQQGLMKNGNATQRNVNIDSTNIANGYECKKNSSNNDDQDTVLVNNRTNYHENNMES